MTCLAICILMGVFWMYCFVGKGGIAIGGEEGWQYFFWRLTPCWNCGGVIAFETFGGSCCCGCGGGWVFAFSLWSSSSSTTWHCFLLVSLFMWRSVNANNSKALICLELPFGQIFVAWYKLSELPEELLKPTTSSRHSYQSFPFIYGKHRKPSIHSFT